MTLTESRNARSEQLINWARKSTWMDCWHGCFWGMNVFPYSSLLCSGEL